MDVFPAGERKEKKERKEKGPSVRLRLPMPHLISDRRRSA